MERVIESPIGPIYAVATDHGISELTIGGSRRREGGVPLRSRAAARWLDRLDRELGAYFTGESRELGIAIDVRGTPFQERVWRLVRAIPFGEVRSYGEIARAAGAPRSARAVGAANGQNRVSLLVPCHRVVGKGGALTGYAWGIEKKRWLLAHEAARS
ncbi:MAG: methylated-DNA--[protein]-cysteine S-methyltransferase [Myxococcales bacterium]|nr:methylated-DNA--[protein]-cysteine S-methyltransferase [Myxococcales bacterium]